MEDRLCTFYIFKRGGHRIKRPLLWVFGILCMTFLLLRLCCGSKMDEWYYSMDSYIEDSVDATLTGTLDYIDTKPNSFYFFLKKVYVTLKKEQKQFYFSDFLVVIKEKSSDFPASGNVLTVDGRIYPFLSPSNPGQFDEKAYYKERNIFYKMTASDFCIVNGKTNPVKQFLYDLRARITGVYQECMAEKDAGVVSAMLLGDKALLDNDIRSLYQANGIGHILAISGLHITLICTLLYRLLLVFRLPRPMPFLIALIFLIGYGEMTGFGISTSRAVIMMLLSLFAVEIGRSYDALTAMAVSAVWILLQKPYALFSGSFLLSYSSVLGVFLTFPALKGILLGNFSMQEARKRKRMRRRREMMANIHAVRENIGTHIPILKSPAAIQLIHLIMEKGILSLPEKLLSSILLSVSIWITTLPVVLYFFYEIPTYGILLNLFVIPLVSVVVTFSMLGGILGLFLLPAARLFLSCVALILHFYEFLCNCCLTLPEPIQILGCPSMVQVILYYLVLACLLFYGNHLLYHKAKKNRFAVLFCFLPAMVVLLYRVPVSGLQFTMLDVGQGDGLLLRSGTGKTILVDGGSTDVSEVGTYRILPCLKYYGIRRIDYMIMTHSDEDHISGERELMEKSRTGVTIGCYLMPCLAEESMDENYRKIRKTAFDMGIPVRYFNTGDSIQMGELKLLCLHPDREFLNGSANACSTTISLTYGVFRMLLTGDLEKEGEAAVTKRLQDNMLPKYTVLKVAHHGSKNSTSEEFLSIVRPQAALISCGRKNRYGHPHSDLLQRLEKSSWKIYQTSECGAIQIITDGKRYSVRAYRKTD